MVLTANNIFQTESLQFFLSGRGGGEGAGDSEGMYVSSPRVPNQKTLNLKCRIIGEEFRGDHGDITTADPDNDVIGRLKVTHLDIMNSENAIKLDLDPENIFQTRRIIDLPL